MPRGIRVSPRGLGIWGPVKLNNPSSIPLGYPPGYPPWYPQMCGILTVTILGIPQQSTKNPISNQTKTSKTKPSCYRNQLFKAGIYHRVTRTPQVLFLGPEVEISKVPGLERSSPRVLAARQMCTPRPLSPDVSPRDANMGVWGGVLEVFWKCSGGCSGGVLGVFWECSGGSQGSGLDFEGFPAATFERFVELWGGTIIIHRNDYKRFSEWPV
jgi:hypothetical protein